MAVKEAASHVPLFASRRPDPRSALLGVDLVLAGSTQNRLTRIPADFLRVFLLSSSRICSRFGRQPAFLCLDEEYIYTTRQTLRWNATSARHTQLTLLKVLLGCRNLDWCNHRSRHACHAQDWIPTRWNFSPTDLSPSQQNPVLQDISGEYSHRPLGNRRFKTISTSPGIRPQSCPIRVSHSAWIA